MSKRRRIAIGCSAALLLLLALAAAVAVLFLTRPSALYSDPQRVRPWGLEQYRRCLAPAQTAPPADTALLDALKPTITTDTLELIFKTTETIRGDQINYTVHRLPPGGGALPATASMSVTLRHLGIVLPHPNEVDRSISEGGYGRFPLRLYTPEGRPLTDDESRQALGKSWEWLKTDHSRASGHKVKFFFDLEGFDRPKVLGSWLFDRATKASVSPGASWHHPKENPREMGRGMTTWRSAPVELILDIAHGPVQTRDVLPRVGERAVFDAFECRLLAIAQGQSDSSSQSDERFKMHFRKPYPGHKGTHVYLFGVSPRCQSRSLGIEALDKSGKSLNEGSGDYDSNYFHVTVTKPQKQVDKLRIIYRPHTARVILPVDSIPGLPPENASVQNLFDVRIPYAYVANEWRLRDLLAGSLQLQVNPPPGNPTIPSGFFPREYRDVTPREILNDYLSLYPQAPVQIDIKEGRLHFEQPKSIGQRIQENWRRLRNTLSR